MRFEKIEDLSQDEIEEIIYRNLVEQTEVSHGCGYWKELEKEVKMLKDELAKRKTKTV